jgi:hypothetical protein
MTNARPIVVVSTHARDRAAERGLTPWAIAREVEAALAAGRKSRRKPRWMTETGRRGPLSDRSIWFVWREDRRFAWVVRVRSQEIVVKTTLEGVAGNGDEAAA